MLFFKNKNKDEAAASVKAAAPISRPLVDADDFFKDLERKPKKKAPEFNIDVPEVTGLREAPLEPPGSTIKNAAQVSTEGLIDKTKLDDNQIRGDIRTVVTADMDLDASFEKIKEEKISSKAVVKELDPTNPEDFFKDLDRKKPKPVKVDIDVPEVTGLREAPDEPPGSTITDIGEINADSLIDKTALGAPLPAEITEIDTGIIDTDILESKQV